MNVTVTHPVTGASRIVDESRVEHYTDLGWDYQPSKPRREAPPEDPDVEAGKAALKERTGESPGELPAVSKATKKAARSRKKAQSQEAAVSPGSDAEAVNAVTTDDAKVQQGGDPEALAKMEAEAGHAGLQVDKGATNA